MAEMDMKEKLVELLYEAHSKITDVCCLGGKDMSYAEQVEMEADHLIANGIGSVTDNNVGSKWISVKDRLPEDDSNVLAYLPIGEEGRIYPANYAKGVWWDCIFNTPAQVTTHWMPLPEPPKGE